MPPSLEQRLRDLDHDDLVQIIVGLASSNKKLAKVIAAEIMSTPERIASVKRSITSLRKIQDRRTRVYAHEVADKIRDVMRQISTISRHDLGAAFELVCKLITEEATILYGFDDSSGMAMAAFRKEVSQSFTALVQRLSDAKVLLKGLRSICEHDEFGTVEILLREACEYLPDDVAYALVAYLRERVPSAVAESDVWSSDLALLKAVYAARGDVESYLSLMAEYPQDLQSDVVTVAELFLGHDNLEATDVWLSKITAHTYKHDTRAEQVRRTWRARSTDSAAIERQARNCILVSFSPIDISFYHDRFGDQALQSLMKECAAGFAATLNTSTPELSICTILTIRGYGGAISSFIEEHNPSPGGSMRELLGLVDALTEHGFPRAATLLTRSCIEFATNNANTQYYGFVAQLYCRLQEQSALIADWGKYTPHDSYISAFNERHRQKHQLWTWISSIR